MTRHEIKQTIEGFLKLIEQGCGTTDETEATLSLLLDKLALAQHFADYSFDETDYPDVPRKNYEELRKTVLSRFPNYGHYNVAECVTQNVGDGKSIVGDAIDDIEDITADLYEAKWRWDNHSIEDGIWYFKFSFWSHWAQHLRNLQMYLLNLDNGKDFI